MVGLWASVVGLCCGLRDLVSRGFGRFDLLIRYFVVSVWFARLIVLRVW